MLGWGGKSCGLGKGFCPPYQKAVQVSPSLVLVLFSGLCGSPAKRQTLFWSYPCAANPALLHLGLDSAWC